MSGDEHILVTEATQKELQKLKEPGGTYDDLLRDLVQRRRREELEDRFQKLEEIDSDELISLNNT